MAWWKIKKELSSAIKEWESLIEDYELRLKNLYKNKEENYREIRKTNNKIINAKSILHKLKTTQDEQKSVSGRVQSSRSRNIK